jgi:hypothetical protein
MATEEQIEANRVNGRKAAGKPRDTARSRLNAIDHGLLAMGVTELDNADSYCALLNKLQAEFEPLGEIETFLVERIVLSMIRVRRSVRFEAEAIEAALHPERRSKSKLDQEMEQRLVEMGGDAPIIESGFDPHLRSDTVASLADALGRYETLHERRLWRTLQELERLQIARKTTRTAALSPTTSAVTL